MGTVLRATLASGSDESGVLMVQREVDEGAFYTASLAGCLGNTGDRGGPPAPQSKPELEGEACRNWRKGRPDSAQFGLLAGLTRRQAQDLAERWKPEALDTRGRYRQLFCTPVLISLPETIGEWQLDRVLHFANRQLDLPAQLQDRLRDGGLTPLVVSNELCAMSGIVRTSPDQVSRAVRTPSVREFRRVVASWSRNLATPMRRSTAFLYYLVGIHAAVDDDSRFLDGAPFEGLSRSAEQVIAERMGLEATVQVRLFRGFHDGLWEGVWMYQDARLFQVAAQVSRSHADRGTINAQLMTEVSRDGHSVFVGFRADDGAASIGQHFRLVGRPGDDPSISLERISRILQSAGVNGIDASGRVSRQSHLAMWNSSRTIFTDRLSVPL